MKEIKVGVIEGSHQGKVGKVIYPTTLKIQVISSEQKGENQIDVNPNSLKIIEENVPTLVNKIPDVDIHFTAKVKANGDVVLSQNAVNFFGLGQNQGFDFFMVISPKKGDQSIYFGIPVNNPDRARFKLKPGTNNIFSGPAKASEVIRSLIGANVYINFYISQSNQEGWAMFLVEPDAEAAWSYVSSKKNKSDTQEKYLIKLRKYLFK